MIPARLRMSTAEYRATAKPKKSKYGAVPTVVDGVRFDSKREAKRYAELKLLQRAGEISALCRQHTWILAPAVKIEGEKRARPAIRAVMDFVYRDCATGMLVAEDVKGMETPVSRLKRHLMKSIHNIDVRIVK